MASKIERWNFPFQGKNRLKKKSLNRKCVCSPTACCDHRYCRTRHTAACWLPPSGCWKLLQGRDHILPSTLTSGTNTCQISKHNNPPFNWRKTILMLRGQENSCNKVQSWPHGCYSPTVWTEVPAMPFTSCVTLGKILNPSVPQFALSKHKIIIALTSQSCYKDYVNQYV